MKKRPAQDKDAGEKFDLVKTFRDLHHKVFPIMRYLGPYCAFDAVLVIKLVRLGKTFMTKVNISYRNLKLPRSVY